LRRCSLHFPCLVLQVSRFAAATGLQGFRPTAALRSWTKIINLHHGSQPNHQPNNQQTHQPPTQPTHEPSRKPALCHQTNSPTEPNRLTNQPTNQPNPTNQPKPNQGPYHTKAAMLGLRFCGLLTNQPGRPSHQANQLNQADKPTNQQKQPPQPTNQNPTRDPT